MTKNDERTLGRLRHGLLVAAGAVLLGGCGADTPEPASSATDAAPHREVISEAMEAKVKDVKLTSRDTPLEVGDLAPDLSALEGSGFEAGKPAIIVFYRGHW